MAVILPASLVHDESALGDGDAVRPWLSKKRKVARALSDRLRTVQVCICGAARQMEPSPLALRPRANRNPAANGNDASLAAADDEENALDAVDVVQARASVVVGGGPPGGPPGRDAARRHVEHGERHDSPSVDDARSLMVQHTEQCVLADGGDFDGACSQLDERALDGDGCGSCAGSDADQEEVPPRSDQDGNGAPKEATADPAVNDSSLQDVPFLASGTWSDPALRQFAPPLDIVRDVLEGRHVLQVVGDAASNAYRDRIAEEEFMLRMFLVRMRTDAFVDWGTSHSMHFGAVREAVESVMTKLESSREALPGVHCCTL